MFTLPFFYKENKFVILHQANWFYLNSLEIIRIVKGKHIKNVKKNLEKTLEKQSS